MGKSESSSFVPLPRRQQRPQVTPGVVLIQTEGQLFRRADGSLEFLGQAREVVVEPVLDSPASEDRYIGYRDRLRVTPPP